MKKLEKQRIAKDITDWLRRMLPEGINSHQDDIDTIESVVMDEFPFLDLEANEICHRFWDDRKGWIVTDRDIK